MIDSSGTAMVAGITWLVLCGFVRWRCRRNGFPTAVSFWAGLAGPSGLLACCVVALVLLLLKALS